MNQKIFLTIIIMILFYNGVYARGIIYDGRGNDSPWPIIALSFFGIYYIIYKVKRWKMIQKSKLDLENALREDSSWDIQGLKSHVTHVFHEYYEDLKEKNTTNMKSYMTKKCHAKISRYIEYQLTGNQRILKNITLKELNFMSVRDHPGKNGDVFTIEVSMSLIDYIIDEKTGKFLESRIPSRGRYESYKHYKERVMTKNTDILEYYVFIRCDNKWLLNNIKPKFSIIGDINGLPESEINKILQQEKNPKFTSDHILYTD